MNKMPPQTSEIFKVLSKGLFISSNSSNQEVVRLYQTIEAEGNFELLCEVSEGEK